jgi:hypothetical protein
MEMEHEASRRTFMKWAAMLGGLGALLGMGRRAVSPKPAEPEAEQEQPHQGYRLTEHVKKYYETARL